MPNKFYKLDKLFFRHEFLIFFTEEWKNVNAIKSFN